MRRRTVLLLVAAAACLGAAGWLLAPYLKPKPKPSTAEQVVNAITAPDPEEMGEKEAEGWLRQVAALTERLPPHEMQKFVERALTDPKLRERFESLRPEDRQKLVGLVSEEQRARMMAKMATGFVAMLKSMPAPLRKAALQQMRERGEAARGKDGRGQMSKQRVAQWLSATTPTQRAEMVRAMREMRKMMQEAGIKE
jgi:Mg/Co/Ni transporter MgtE